MVNLQLNCDCATKEMLETTKEKMMHISSSSASVREFDASKLVVYWKSMIFERLICFATFPINLQCKRERTCTAQGKVVEESSLFITVNKKKKNVV